MINFVVPKLKFEQIYKKFYIDHHNIFTFIREENYKFIYRSPDFDDLNMMCRENLKYWESNSRYIFSELCKTSNVILDIGSYSGIYSIIASKVNKKADIYAFEPNPNMFDVSKKNFKINNLRNIKVFNIAISDVVGESYLFQNHENYTSVYSLKESKNDGARFKVETITLDEVIKNQNINKIDLIKIDIEGFELNAIKGFKSNIQTFQPIMIIECLTEIDIRNIHDFLKEYGYEKVFQINGNDFDQRNYLWIPASKNYLLNKFEILLTEFIFE